ncbi:UNVERIFIED_CONTAM: hypothetical protein K2H54_007987 [Gekko kuhli]
MEEPIYEEMIPMETLAREEDVPDGGNMDAEEPISEEMKPVASEGSELVKEAVVQEEWERCVRDLLELLDHEEIDFFVFAKIVEASHNPVPRGCCQHCNEIAWYHDLRSRREAHEAWKITKRSGEGPGDADMKPPELMKEGKDDPKKDQEDDPKKDQEDDSKKDQEEEPAKVSRTPCMRVLYPDVSPKKRGGDGGVMRREG